MTEEEKAWCNSVRRQAMSIVGIVGNIEIDAEPNSVQAKRARKAALAAMALAGEAGRRMVDAGLVADVAELESTGYDLSTLVSAPPATLED